MARWCRRPLSRARAPSATFSHHLLAGIPAASTIASTSERSVIATAVRRSDGPPQPRSRQAPGFVVEGPGVPHAARDDLGQASAGSVVLRGQAGPVLDGPDGECHAGAWSFNSGRGATLVLLPTGASRCPITAASSPLSCDSDSSTKSRKWVMSSRARSAELVHDVVRRHRARRARLPAKPPPAR